MSTLTRLTLALAAAALVGCQATAQGVISVNPKTGGSATPKPDAKPAATAPAVRSVELFVKAPAGLVAAGGGNIVNSDVNGLAASGGLNLVAAGAGNLVAAGAGNIVAAGGGNLVAAGAGNLLVKTPAFRLQAGSIDDFKPVEKAVVFFKQLTAEGKLVSKTAATTDAEGHITFEAVQDANVIAVARFKLGDKVFEMTGPIAKGKQVDPTMVDPINTFVTGRIRTILKDNCIDDAPLVLQDLKEVWTFFNDAKIALTADDLKQDASLADLDAFYKKFLPQLPEAGQAKVKEYMGKIAAAKKCN